MDITALTSPPPLFFFTHYFSPSPPFYALLSFLFSLAVQACTDHTRAHTHTHSLAYKNLHFAQRASSLPPAEIHFIFTIRSILDHP